MFTTYWEMQFNPFSKIYSDKYLYKSVDFNHAIDRMKYLENVKGIGLFTGLSGFGKTYTLKKYTESLNTSLYKILYLPLSTLSVIEFYRSIAIALGIVPAFKKIDLFNSIQERILFLSKDKRITTIIILDEAQYLNTKIFNDLSIILNFEMDSVNHVVTLITGQPLLNNILSMNSHEALTQRIIVNYTFTGLSKDELPDYISSRLKACGVQRNLFNNNSIEAIWNLSGSSPRVINSLAEKCLHIGFLNNAKLIDQEIVLIASGELSLL
jgi:type II secretory pathway predicted ATPase ExeA